MPSSRLSSVVPFSTCPQSLPASEYFPVSQFFAWGGQSIGVSASATFLPKKSQGWSPLEWTGWISLQSRTLRGLLQHHSSKASILQCLAFFIVQLSHPYMTTGKTIVLTRRTFVGKVMSMLLNMLSRLVITFLPRSKCLLISWPTYYTVFLTSVSICKFITIPNRSVSRTIPDKYLELYWGKKLKCWKVTLISDFFFTISCRKKILSSLP